MYLAAGTVLDVPLTSMVSVASRAGYAGLGLRVTPSEVDQQTRALLRRQIADSGLALLDLEVARLRPGESPQMLRSLIDLAGELGARWVTTVSHLPDPVETVDKLAQIAAIGDEVGVGIALEFMRFTNVPDLESATLLVRRIAASNLAVLVDALHLARSGQRLDAVGSLDRHELAFVQLCDAPITGPATLSALIDEARNARLLPGAGELDLNSFLCVIPADIPVSVEVQSRELMRTLDPIQRASTALRSAREVLPRQDG